jgi:hypothetical protein
MERRFETLPGLNETFAIINLFFNSVNHFVDLVLAKG